MYNFKLTEIKQFNELLNTKIQNIQIELEKVSLHTDTLTQIIEEASGEKFQKKLLHHYDEIKIYMVDGLIYQLLVTDTFLTAFF
ncbi:hypothetical protein HZS_1361 [Henneguya salminicola]|nr:hypothetical protein HZS_1361 [Henneguya salminicola]